MAAAVGAAGGAFGAVAGLGGGVVIVPLLTAAGPLGLSLGLSQRQATATSLTAVVATALASSSRYWLAAPPDPTVAGSLIVPATAAAVALAACATVPLGARMLYRSVGICRHCVITLVSPSLVTLPQGPQLFLLLLGPCVLCTSSFCAYTEPLPTKTLDHHHHHHFILPTFSFFSPCCTLPRNRGQAAG